jgi:hypothetical protein
VQLLLARDRPDAGSLYNLCWSSDGALVAAACGTGAVCIASLLDRYISLSLSLFPSC